LAAAEVAAHGFLCVCVCVSLLNMYTDRFWLHILVPVDVYTSLLLAYI